MSQIYFEKNDTTTQNCVVRLISTKNTNLLSKFTVISFIYFTTY